MYQYLHWCNACSLKTTICYRCFLKKAPSQNFGGNCKWRTDKLFSGMYTQETQFGAEPGLQPRSLQHVEFKWATAFPSYVSERQEADYCVPGHQNAPSLRTNL